MEYITHSRSYCHGTIDKQYVDIYLDDDTSITLPNNNIDIIANYAIQASFGKK